MFHAVIVVNENTHFSHLNRSVSFLYAWHKFLFVIVYVFCFLIIFVIILLYYRE